MTEQEYQVEIEQLKTQVRSHNEAWQGLQDSYHERLAEITRLKARLDYHVRDAQTSFENWQLAKGEVERLKSKLRPRKRWDIEGEGLDILLSELGLTQRVFGVLVRDSDYYASDYTVGMLICQTWRDLVGTRNLGEKGIAEVKQVLRAKGYQSLCPEYHWLNDEEVEQHG